MKLLYASVVGETSLKWRMEVGNVTLVAGILIARYVRDEFISMVDTSD